MRLSSSCVYAAVATALLTGAGAPVVTPPQAAPKPNRTSPPPAPRNAVKPPQILRPPESARPDMVHIPKSYLVSGLERRGGQTFLTGPNDAVVLGPVNIRVVPTVATAQPASRR